MHYPSMPYAADARESSESYKRQADTDGYLKGLVWLMHMYLVGERPVSFGMPTIQCNVSKLIICSYTVGECPDYRYFYDGNAPKASDLVALCKKTVRPRLLLY